MTNIFIKKNQRCRVSGWQGAAVWEARTGNVITRSSISKERAIELHKRKLAQMGIRAGNYRDERKCKIGI